MEIGKTGNDRPGNRPGFFRGIGLDAGRRTIIDQLSEIGDVGFLRRIFRPVSGLYFPGERGSPAVFDLDGGVIELASVSVDRSRSYSKWDCLVRGFSAHPYSDEIITSFRDYQRVMDAFELGEPTILGERIILPVSLHLVRTAGLDNKFTLPRDNLVYRVGEVGGKLSRIYLSKPELEAVINRTLPKKKS